MRSTAFPTLRKVTARNYARTVILRFAWLAVAALAWCGQCAVADRPDAVVTFHEVNYHPPGSQDAEWLELHNQMAVDIDLSGWSLTDGIGFTFPPGTVIAGGGFLVVAKLPGHPSLAGVAGVLGPWQGNLSNGGETIDLRSRSGRLMDRLSYGDSGEWPVAADGAGATLAKRRAGTTAADSANWRASAQAGGTPGAANFPAADQPVLHLLANADSLWRYHDGPASPAADWMDSPFDDSAWWEGLGPFGSAAVTPVLGVTVGLVSRYRAGAVTGVANGAAFSPWTDTATDDGVAQNAAAGSDPRFVANATPSGEPAVSFDGNDQFRASLTPGIGPNDGFAYFLVCKGSTALTNGGLFDGSGAYLFDRVATVGNPLVSLKAVDGRYGFQKRYDDGSGLGGPVSATPISTSQFQIVAVRRNRAADRFEIWVDGTMEASTTDSGAPLTPQPIVIGRHATASTGGFKGEIAEILIYRGSLSDAEFLAAGTYLEGRYGLATAFPDAAPRTLFAAGTSTACLRRTFNFSGDPSRTTLQLEHTLADGAVFFLNGQEFARVNLPPGEIDHATAALSDVPQLLPAQPLALPAGDLLRHGANVLAVSLHTGAGDDTSWFSASLGAAEMLPDPDLPAALELHEIAGADSGSFFIELRNPGTAATSTAGFALERLGGTTGRFDFQATSVPPGGLVHYDAAQLGFVPAAGDKIVLRAPDGSPVDACVTDSQARGRCAAWPGRWLLPAAPTPGAENHFALTTDVVIHELCYHPPDITAASADKQWLELHNCGPARIDLGGWRFASGISFDFPAGTAIAPGGFLVVARNPAAVQAAPGTTVLGPWSGRLARGGEMLRLLDADGNPADEVRYSDGGRWPEVADGGGSTLELRDPRADNALPEAWAASNEAARRGWQTINYRATAAASPVGPDGQWREFVFGLLGAGEVLLDDLEVIEDPDGARVPMIANGDFAAGLAGWRFLGNHRHARIVPDPDNPGNTVLHLRAVGPTEHMHNHVETTLAGGRAVTNGRVYQIRYRARWLSGSHLLNTRLYFNRLARTSALDRSDTPGTPGAPNSTAAANLGPGFLAFFHAPAVPAPGEPVTVTARAADSDGIAWLTLHHSVNGGPFTATPMTPADDGATFTATIPGQAVAAVVRFHAAATDAATPAASSFFPPAGPASHAFYQVNDGLAATNGLHNLRIVMAPDDQALLYQTNNLMSNERLGCTVVYDEREVWYDAGVRLKGSERGRPSPARLGFHLSFPRDRPFRGVHRTVAIDRSEGQVTGCQELLYDHMMYASGGIPAEFNDLCKVIAPDPAHTSHAILQLARYGDVFLDSQFANGAAGTAWEYELIYYPTTADAGGYKLPQPDSVTGTDLTNLGDDKENYRWNFLIENNRDRDDFAAIIALAKHFDQPAAAFEAGLDAVLDADQWLHALACSCASGAGDSFFSNANHNGIFYARPDGRVLYFPHDMDFSFSATRSIFQNQELQRLTANPVRRRAYLGRLHHLCTTVFNRSYMSAWTSHYGRLLPGENFAAHLDYIHNRSTYILGAIDADLPPLAFEITTHGGANFSTASSPVTLAGNGWVNIREIRLAGSAVPLAVTWTSASTWQTAVPLAYGPNPLTLEAVDFSGQIVGSDSITVTNTSDIRPPLPHTLAIAEIYYNPPGNIETTEYLELLNTSDATLDLSGTAFTAGINFVFPAGTLLAPGTRTVVVKDIAAFTAAFGPGRPIAGSFPNSLDNSGERLELRRADNLLLHSFRYNDQPPWPVEADGDGHSLVLVDPWSAPDHADPRNWRASLAPDGGTPGFADTQGYADWRAAHGDHADDEDRDGDGFDTRQEYFLGGDPTVAEPWLAPSLVRQPDGTLRISITRRVAAEGASVTPENSTDLAAWVADPTAVWLGAARLAGEPARDLVSFRLTPPPDAARLFIRFAFGRR